jgi:hypothetical protein
MCLTSLDKRCVTSDLFIGNASHRMVYMRRAILQHLPHKGDRRWSISIPVYGLLQHSRCEPERSHCRHHQVSCTAVGISIMNSSVILRKNVRTAIVAWNQCGSQVISLLGPAISSIAMTRTVRTGNRMFDPSYPLRLVSPRNTILEPTHHTSEAFSHRRRD